ncbi:hypothetical protein Tco_0294661 [Tanacetum coccineum]
MNVRTNKNPKYHLEEMRQYCPPFKTARKLEEIWSFQQGIDETLYHAWERYSDLLYRCPQHDLNSHQKVQIFYTGLETPTRIMLDSKGFIHLMTPTQVLDSIQIMTNHSHSWYDGATTRERTNDISDNVDTKKLKDNIHAFQVSCKIFKEEHLTKECPLKKEDKAVEQSKYIGSLEETVIKHCEDSIKKQVSNDEWIRKFIKNTDLNLRALETTTKNLHVQANQLAQMVLTNIGKRVKAKTKIGKEDMKEPVPRDLPVVQPYVPLMLFPGHLKGNSYKTHEVVCMIGIPEKTHNKAEVDNGWDITIKDVERLRQILTPTVHLFPTLNLNQWCNHFTSIPPDDNYVAPATSPILDKNLNEFGKKFFDITRVDEKADGNPIKDVKDLSEMIKTYDFETFIQKLLHRVPASRSGFESLIDVGFDVGKDRIRALEQVTWDLDVENKQIKVLKASYGVTTSQELHRLFTSSSGGFGRNAFTERNAGANEDGSIQRGKISSKLFVPVWSLTTNTSLNNTELCRDMMIHLAPPAVRADQNCLLDNQALQKACFDLGRGALVQIDMLQRYEALRLSKSYKALQKDHLECVGQDVGLIKRNKEPEEDLANKTFELEESDSDVSRLQKDLEKLVVKVGQSEIVKFIYYKEILPAVVPCLYQSTEYKKGIVVPFNLAIVVGWAEELKVGHS